ncbi:MAG TPA: hypothetical protein VFM18_17485 [Methanosarcina sp.]|nr:hypothetical protein [Methanosarcina sp.]
MTTVGKAVRALPSRITKEQALEFIKKISGRPRRTLSGQEHNDIWLLIQLLDATSISNNQRTITYEYEVAGKEYHVTYGFGDDPLIEEILNEE